MYTPLTLYLHRCIVIAFCSLLTLLHVYGLVLLTHTLFCTKIATDCIAALIVPPPVSNLLTSCCRISLGTHIAGSYSANFGTEILNHGYFNSTHRQTNKQTTGRRSSMRIVRIATNQHQLASLFIPKSEIFEPALKLAFDSTKHNTNTIRS